MSHLIIINSLMKCVYDNESKGTTELFDQHEYLIHLYLRI